jgi:DNA-binding transcriptional MocR family regulator
MSPSKEEAAMWMPSLIDRAGPKYLRIADAIAGPPKVGERLPTHRDLAWRLGVTVGTVSRATAGIGRRGLVAGGAAASSSRHPIPGHA